MRSLTLVCCASLLACGQAIPSAESGKPEKASDLAPLYAIESDRRSIRVTYGGETKVCEVDMEIDKVSPSFDRSALMVSHDSYIPVEEISDCGTDLISPKKISSESGILSDINIRHGIYIALLPVSTQPFSYLATVSRIDSNKNLTSLPGSYIEGMSAEDQLQSAFVYSDDGEFSAKISRNGRYVAVNGEIDCSEDAYPGVWDVEQSMKVVLRNDVAETACNDLFH